MWLYWKYLKNCRYLTIWWTMWFYSVYPEVKPRLQLVSNLLTVGKMSPWILMRHASSCETTVLLNLWCNEMMMMRTNDLFCSLSLPAPHAKRKSCILTQIKDIQSHKAHKHIHAQEQEPKRVFWSEDSWAERYTRQHGFAICAKVSLGVTGKLHNSWCDKSLQTP